MKSTFFNEILDETTIQVNDSYQDTINKLRLQNGLCRKTNFDEEKLRFKCSKKGKIIVDNNSLLSYIGGYKYYAAGEVLVEDGKTVVKVYSINARYRVIFHSLIAVLLTLLFIASFSLFILNRSILRLLKTLCVFIFAAVDIWGVISEVRRIGVNLDLMKDEIIKRVEAINHWEK